jgi:mono/diheme cytochrome c family protein
LASFAAFAVAAACRPADDGPQGLYRKHCARCHGLDGRGNPRAVDSKPGLDLTTSELMAEGERAEVRRRIVDGEGTMPAFGDKLTAEEIESLVELSYELAGLPSSGAANREGGDDGP